MTGLRERATAMVERVTLEATHCLGHDSAADVRRAVTAALLHRDARVQDDHDPRLLHPARTVLILMADASCRDVGTLAAAAFVDSQDLELAPDGGAAAVVIGEDAARLLDEVPLPTGQGDDELLERLVCAPEAAALIAVAERLDHARHLHLRPELPWLEWHAQVQDAYAPAARRLSPLIARRLERWAEAFRVRRLLV
jgi:hypothetical protein